MLDLSIALVANLLNSHSCLLLTAGLSLYAFGAGMVNAGLYRLTLYSSNEGKDSIAAMLGMISILTLAAGIEVAKSVILAAARRGSVRLTSLLACCGLA